MTDNDVFDTRDKLVNTLEKQKQNLKAKFRELMETDTNRLPLEPYERWPKEARTLFDEYGRVVSEITRRNAQRGQAQLSAFVKELWSRRRPRPRRRPLPTGPHCSLIGFRIRGILAPWCGWRKLSGRAR